MDKRSGAGLNHTDTGADIELRCFRLDEQTDVDDTRDDDLNQIESDNESASAFDNIRLELSEYDVGHSFGEQRNSVNSGMADGRPGQLGRGINRHSDSLTNNKRWVEDMHSYYVNETYKANTYIV